jgi:hypothetical protein
MDTPVHMFDIKAWAEDRQEIKDLKKALVEADRAKLALALRLVADAQKIVAACNQLDSLALNLSHQAPAPVPTHDPDWPTR